jgi:hypothetical protein
MANRLLGTISALVCFGAGVAILAGLAQDAAPRSLRIGCGSILILLGIGRWALTRQQARPPRRRRFVDDLHR